MSKIAGELKTLIMKENNVKYKWSTIFASKRYNTEDGTIKLTPLEQQEMLDDIEKGDVSTKINKDEKRLEALKEINRILRGIT